MYAGALSTRVLSTPGLARWVVHLLVSAMYVNRVGNCSFVENSLVMSIVLPPVSCCSFCLAL